MEKVTVRAALQTRVLLVVTGLTACGVIFWGYWPSSGSVGRSVLVAIAVTFWFLGWQEQKAYTTFDPTARRVEIVRFLRTYEFGFDDVEEVWVPRQGPIRLIVKQGTELSPLLAIHGRRVPITTVPEGQRWVVGQIAEVLGVPIRGSYRYRVEDQH